MQKVLVIGQLPPPVHGSNVMTERFIAALGENNFAVQIVEKNFSTQLSEVGKRNPKKLLKVPGFYQRVRKAIGTQHPNICVYFISVGLQSLLVDCLLLSLLRRRKVPYLLYFHGLGYQQYETSNMLIRSILRKNLSRAFGGLVLGERLKADVCSFVPEKRLFVLPNAIPSLDQVAAIAVSHPLPQPDVHILFLSNLIPSKGPMVFLKVAERICKSESNVCFTLVGRHASENYLTELRAYIKTAGLDERVAIPGPLYGEEKNALFKSSDIFLFPTTYARETFGLVNLEAMQWGLPVISSPVGAIPEIIQDGVNGYIVDPADLSLLTERVLALVRDQGLRQRMGAAGQRLFAENYSLEAYRENLRSAMAFFNGLKLVDH